MNAFLVGFLGQFYYRAGEICDFLPKSAHQLSTGGMAKPGRFGSLTFAMTSSHFGGVSSRALAGKARECGRFWVFACVPNPGKQSIWRQCPPSARKQSTKNAQIIPFYPCTVEVSTPPPPKKNKYLSIDLSIYLYTYI